MLWLFNGDAEAGAYFGEGAAVADGWSDAVSQNIDGFSVPIGGGAATGVDAPVDAPAGGNGTAVEEAPTTEDGATTEVEAPVEGGAADGSLTVEDGAIDGSVDAGIAAAPVAGGATGWTSV
jgi:hypothetical protein